MSGVNLRSLLRSFAHMFDWWRTMINRMFRVVDSANFVTLNQTGQSYRLDYYWRLYFSSGDSFTAMHCLVRWRARRWRTTLTTLNGAPDSRADGQPISESATLSYRIAIIYWIPGRHRFGRTSCDGETGPLARLSPMGSWHVRFPDRTMKNAWCDCQEGSIANFMDIRHQPTKRNFSN